MHAKLLTVLFLKGLIHQTTYIFKLKRVTSESSISQKISIFHLVIKQQLGDNLAIISIIFQTWLHMVIRHLIL